MTPAGLTTRPLAQGGITVPSIGGKGNFFKNPLGIIGIFLVLTEAIASLVIVNSHLNDLQNTILVLFIVLFPCLVLGVFFLLVTRHHEKLYSPGDYKDERNFVNTYNSLTQKEELTNVCSSAVPEALMSVTENDLQPIKDALAEVMELQKKIVLNSESPILSEAETHGFIASADDFLSEMEDSSSSFTVDISCMPKSDLLARRLNSMGYSSKVYQLPFGTSSSLSSLAGHTAIWMGDEVPAEMAVQVVKTSRELYPHLKYICLNDAKDGAPNYVKYQIFIGGATSTAKERGLKPLLPRDFARLYQITDQKALHAFIRGFEP